MLNSDSALSQLSNRTSGSVWIAVFAPVVLGLLVRERLVGCGQLLEFLLVATFVRMHGRAELSVRFADLFVGRFLFSSAFFCLL